ncbi:MAG: hypothetical protein OXE81_13210 [Gammaproteobacteria bacterium]|nr:hypothetical protein [Gammaproteobacteria bacterium]MCY4278768.1 hypothetical protein [Gammaproteobacteria bacterium]
MRSAWRASKRYSVSVITVGLGSDSISACADDYGASSGQPQKRYGNRHDARNASYLPFDHTNFHAVHFAAQYRHGSI